MGCGKAEKKKNSQRFIDRSTKTVAGAPNTKVSRLGNREGWWLRPLQRRVLNVTLRPNPAKDRSGILSKDISKRDLLRTIREYLTRHRTKRFRLL